MPRLSFALALLMIISGLGPPTNGGGDDLTTVLTIDESRSDDDQVLLQWAISRFAAAKLDLPAARVGFHDEMGPCDGHPGLYRDQPSPRIDLCGFTTISTAAKRTMLHELAHAWAGANLTDDDIDRFLVMRGLETWAGTGAPWELRGSEHAAEILSWALSDQKLDLVAIPDAGIEAIEAAYQLLTGRALPDR